MSTEQVGVDQYEPKRAEPRYCDACGDQLHWNWGAERRVVCPGETPDAWYFCSERCEEGFMGESYYAESRSEDGSMLWFEAGASGEDVVMEGRALARCDLPRKRVPPDDRAIPCEMHAVARIEWGDGTTTKVCRKHYEEVRKGVKTADPHQGGDRE